MINKTNFFSNNYCSLIDGIRNKISFRAAVRINLCLPFVFTEVVAAALIRSKFFPKLTIQRLSLPGLLGGVQMVNFFWNLEISKLLSNSQSHLKNALVIEPADWSAGEDAGFINSLGKWIFGEITRCAYWLNLLQLSKTHSIIHIKPHSEEHLNQQLDLLQNNTIDFVWIIGHGSPESISLNHDFSLDKTSRSIEKIAQKIKTHGKCILFSCSTGQGKRNIAKTLSNAFANTTVYAPKEPVLITCFELTPELLPLYYRDWENTTSGRSYWNGTRVKTGPQEKATVCIPRITYNLPMGGSKRA